MSDWRLAKCLVTLRKQIDALAPNRFKDWDGDVGDDNHKKHPSDHNPNSLHVVTAIDVTHDPMHGFNSYSFADLLRQKNDFRLHYIISNKHIWNKFISPELWREYHGASAHDHHVHISVSQDPTKYDDGREWDLSGFSKEAPVIASAMFKSLTPGGFCSIDPYDHKVPTAIRCNNPGALNTADWVKKQTGYVSSDETTPGNHTAIFRSGEEGVAAYWHLLRNYADAGADTVGKIINKYGGGQDYSDYAAFVEARTGFTPGHRVVLEGDDQNLLKFAKTMFRYEAGRETPLSDEQILLGFRLARGESASV